MAVQIQHLCQRLLRVKEEGALVAVSQLVVEVSLDVIHFRVWNWDLFHLGDVRQSARKDIKLILPLPPSSPVIFSIFTHCKLGPAASLICNWLALTSSEK